MEKRKPMKPMYRTAAEEALILAAINEQRDLRVISRDPLDDRGQEQWDKSFAEYKDAVRSVVRERKEGKRGR